MNTLERLAAALNRLPPVTAIDTERGTITVGDAAGGLSRCRRLASVLAARLVLA